MFTRSTVLGFTGKKLALWFIAYEFVVEHCLPPPTPHVHLASTRRHSRDRCFQAFPALPPPGIILNANRKTKKNGIGLGTRLGVYMFQVDVHSLPWPVYFEWYLPFPPSRGERWWEGLFHFSARMMSNSTYMYVDRVWGRHSTKRKSLRPFLCSVCPWILMVTVSAWLHFNYSMHLIWLQFW